MRKLTPEEREAAKAKRRDTDRERYHAGYRDKVLARAKENPQARVEAKARYRAKHREREMALARARNQANPTKQRGYRQKWFRENKAKVAANTAKYRARKSGAPGDGVSAKQWIDIVEYFGHKCAYCLADTKLTREHVVPLCRQGDDDVGNVVPACERCNFQKSGRLLADFMLLGGGQIRGK